MLYIPEARKMNKAERSSSPKACGRQIWNVRKGMVFGITEGRRDAERWLNMT